MAETEPAQSPANRHWTDGLLVAGVLVLAGLLGAAVVRNSDIWLHLATGRAIADGSYTFGKDPFSFATADREWINHSWLFDLGIYVVFRTAGGTGVAILRMIVAVLIALVLVNIRKRGHSLAVPAVGAAIALVAINARLVLWQPAVVSYLFLAVLTCLLHRGGRALPIAVGVLTAVWSNIDGFFILAPITVGLWLIGSLLKRDERGASRAALAMSLIAALIGAVANPHNIRAYTIPDDLAPAFFTKAVREDPFMTSYTASPLDGKYGQRVGPAPSYAFFGMLGFGFGIFAVAATSRPPWQRLVVWAGFAAIACWRWRLIPFFAVAGTPLVALTLQELLAAQTHGTAARTIASASRWLIVFAFALINAAAWPGWLGPRPTETPTAYRVGPRLQSDPGLEQLTQQIAAAIAVGHLPAGEKIAHPSLDFGHYLAWHAPAAKSFVDTRWRLFEPVVADFLALRQGVFAQGNVEVVLKKYGATSLVINGPPGQALRYARRFWADPKQWPFRAFAGRALMFGWVDPVRGIDDAPNWKLDLARRAFAPQTAPAGAGPSFKEPAQPSFWDLYRTGPPAPPVELAEGEVYLEIAQVAIGLLSEYDAAAQIWGRCSAVGTGVSSALGWSPVDPLVALQLAATGMTGSRLFGRANPENDRWAAPLLAVRSLRAAQVVAPDDPNVFMSLSSAYGLLPTTRGLSTFQSAAALQQAYTRIPVAAAWGLPTNELLFKVADGLAGYYLRGGQVDLGMEFAKQSMELFKVVGLEIAGQNAENEFRGRATDLERYEKELRKRKDDYELRAEKQPPAGRMFLAQQYGLPGEALEVMQKALSGGADHGIDVAQTIELLIRVGRVEDARAILFSERHHPVSMLPPERRPQFRAMNLLVAACVGDYPEALMHVLGVIDDARNVGTATSAAAAVTIAALAVAFDPLVAPAITRLATMEYWWSSAQGPQQAQAQIQEWHMWRGMLALEAGDTRLAKQVFDDIVSSRPQAARRAQPQDIAERYLLFLNRYAK